MASTVSSKQCYVDVGGELKRVKKSITDCRPGRKVQKRESPPFRILGFLSHYLLQEGFVKSRRS